MKSTRAICFLFLCMLLFGLRASAQDFNNYRPVESAAPIPDEFLKLSSTAFEEDKSSIDKSEKRRSKKVKKQFYLESSFMLTRLFHSGRVLFNEPMTDYVNEVADVLLKNDPVLRKEMRFYVVRSSGFNAFATNDGAIFVNEGLLAGIKNEAQLAFVLAHEIIHYREKHVVEFAIENDKIERLRNVDDKILVKSNYSKQQELDADVGGMQYFLNSPYATDQIVPLFELMKYDYLPFYNAFDVDGAVLEQRILPDSFPITRSHSYDLEDASSTEEEYSTHPSIEDRIEQLIVELPEARGANFVLSKDKFKQVQKIARYELCRQYLIDGSFEQAIFAAYQLLAEHNEQDWLQKVIGRSLYSLASYDDVGKLTKVLLNPTADSIMRPLLSYLDSLSKEDLLALAVSRNWTLYKQHPADEELQIINKQLLKLLKENIGRNFDLASTDFVALRYDTTKSQNLDRWAAQLDRFAIWQNDADFMQMYNDIPDRKVKKKRIAFDYSGDDEASRVEYRKGASLGIKKVVLLDPFYVKFDERKKHPVDFLGGEKREGTFEEIIGEICNELGISTTMISADQMKSSDAQSFYNLYLLGNFAGDKGFESPDLLSVDYLQLHELIEKYNTPYLAWPASADLTMPNHGLAGNIMAAVLFWPLAPYMIEQMFEPNFQVLHYMAVYDIEKDIMVKELTHGSAFKSRNDALKSVLYYHFLQLSRDEN